MALNVVYVHPARLTSTPTAAILLLFLFVLFMLKHDQIIRRYADRLRVLDLIVAYAFVNSRATRLPQLVAVRSLEVLLD